jgi:hypothetical protein
LHPWGEHPSIQPDAWDRERHTVSDRDILLPSPRRGQIPQPVELQ